ncbi:MAG: RagB/SusD family nutrient uptake outer membrane protein [Bacteroidales bacterium]|nr:RagB/SusD family nutrient uptake outer membrane protein [Bacteroidales bacterium]
MNIIIKNISKMNQYFRSKLSHWQIIMLLAFFIPFYSCTDTFPEEVLDYKNVYTNVDDADAAILGLYGQFSELAAQVVVLNELRADLMDVTGNATTDLEEINLNRPSENNPWANVTKFYGVIQTCNDILFNFDKMLQEKKMIQAEYDERYSDVAALRTWVYLQLGIHFGKVNYITEPVVSLTDLEDTNADELTLDQLLPELILCMESLPSLEEYQSSKLTLNNIDGYSLSPFFINKKCLLADLYLFDADNSNGYYDKAAKLYRDVLATGEDVGSNTKYRLYTWVWNTTATPNWYQILYRDGRYEDFNSLYNSWREMFAGTTTSSAALNELIWFISYDKKFEPKYPLPKLFDPISESGDYQLKPSVYAVDSVWGGQLQKNGYPFDARGLTGAFVEIGGNYYVRKYSYFQDFPSNDVAGNWFLYRAGMLHLRYAEAANRAGYPMLAWALVNDGIPGTAFVFKKPNGSNYPNDSIRISGDSPFSLYTYPYSFDGRQSDIPYLRQPWRNNGGIRGRANLPNVIFPADALTKHDSILFMEKVIAREAALELGFEGHRWEDLIRIARRLNKETPGAGTHFFWDENLAKKYEITGGGVDMSSPENWFLPLFK